MQIVIDIPEEKYNYVKKQVAEGIDNPLKVYIANGTPLPKGHGRLIDADKEIHELNEMKVQGETFTTAVNFAKILMREAQTVIEADKAGSEEV